VHGKPPVGGVTGFDSGFSGNRWNVYLMLNAVFINQLSGSIAALSTVVDSTMAVCV
jgi:hypothetical protein